MLNSVINYGERATGRANPPKPDIEQMDSAGMIEDDFALASVINQSKKARRAWRRDVAKCAISDLSRLLTGTYIGYPEVSKVEKEQN